MSQLEASAQEASSLRGQYSDLLNDNQRLEREVQHLHEAAGGEGEQYELQKRYSELIANHNATLSTLQTVQEENGRLQAQVHDLTQERNAVIRERNALKQQVATVVRQWEGGARERAELRAALTARAPPDVKRLTDERNAALHEYTLIMSERDTVHKEMEKLSDDLQAALKRVAALESALQASRDEQRATALQAESLRREIASALQDRDRALKECCDLKAPQNSANRGKPRQDNSAYHQLGLSSGSGKEFGNGQHSNDTSLDKLHGLVGMVVDAVEKERVDNLEQANQELERLRGHIDRLQAELQEALQEAEVSKRRRDWAFSERDKIVQERESIRTLCDRLRKERDRAVSDLAEALRDSDDIKKQRNSACKQLKQLKEQLDSEREPRGVPLQDYEWDIIDVELSGLSQDGDLGFELSGGREDPCSPNDHNIYVTSVAKGSVAEGKIKPFDRVTSAVGVTSWASGRAASTSLRLALAHGPALLRLARARAHTAHVRLQDAAGLSLAHGIFISKIASGCSASKENNLFVGDRLISINNRSVEGLTRVSDAMMLLRERQHVALTVARPPVPQAQTNRQSPIRDGSKPYSHSHHASKVVNSCSQTDEPWAMRHYDKSPTEPAAELDRRYVYHVAAGSQGKIHQEKGTWDMIRGKIEAVTGRSKSKDKQNKVPETDAIAELDSVIESYHGKSVKETGSVLKRSRRKNKDSQNDSKNGGTWPKARANFILDENPTGTIVQPRSRKERPPLSILLSPPTKLQPEPQRPNTNRNSNPIPLGHQPLTQSTTPARHSVYKSIESAPANAHFPKPAPLSIHNPYGPPPTSMNVEKFRTIEKDKMVMEDYSEHDMTPNRLSLALNPSDDSLDYQPVTRNRNKSPHSLDFMVNKGPSSLDFVSAKSPSSLDHSIKNHPGKDILEQYYSSKKSSSPKTVNKYPSDSDSFGPDSLNSNINLGMTGTLPSQSRLQSQYYRGPFTNNPHSSRYNPASPTNIPQSQSGESIGTSYEMPSFTSHSHNMSDLQPVRNARGGGDYQHTYEGGTFPRKKENQRFRIPSNPSVTSKNSAGKLSTGSIERSSERNSPMPTFHVEVLSPGRGSKQMTNKATRNSMPEYSSIGWNKPLPGELRRVHIDKSQQPLGIQISCPPGSGGVFVSTVNENSLASQVGLQVGDQLLEVCGINMRSATYTLAANVLRQCGNSITMLVQYSPEKYKDEVEGSGSSSSGESSHDEEVSLSGSPTPRNSPGPQQSLRMEATTTEVSTLRQSHGNKELPRFLLIEMRNCSNLGISLVGGNAVGIFVHSVQKESPAYNAGLRTGDQILEYNNVDLRHATAEQAALELSKPADKVSVLVRHDLQQYHDIKDKPGDAFYIRVGFDRCAKISANTDQLDPYSLWFNKDEVLFVDNTLVNGAPGLWQAWQLDAQGNKLQWGTIPSRFKVEELLRRSMGSLEGDSQQRRASTTARRSFFRRKKHRDSKELASFSNTELGWWSDSGGLGTDDLPLVSYQRVERLHYTSHRPVVILGPMRECLLAKLVSDWPNVFALAHSTRHKASITDKGLHCILDISVATIEKLHKQQIYPIVLLIKFKSTKQIKEVKDTRFPSDKVSAKAAKEMYEHALKLENEFRNYISDIDARYYSDPGRSDKPKKKKPKIEPNKQGYYSEPDAKYFEIDYEFLKELRKIAKKNCPKCKRKRVRKESDRAKYREKGKAKKHVRVKDSYVYCNGRYHSDREHCQLCCKVCNRSTDTLDSMEDEYSLASRSYSLPSSKVVTKKRKNSVQSIKSVSFLESSNDESRQEPNYTAKSFTNDLKQFLLKPAPPRQSLRDKFISSLKQEFEATKKSPKLKAIKGLWKSY
ncbi:hypothetical protein JYU34_001392 [Plutella xylostella]|nr:hypothetical protein JYU34_001392 [Plutella xylostella]